MSCKVRYATDSVALNFDIWAEHLTYERFQTTKLHDEQFVVGCVSLLEQNTLIAQIKLTVHRQVTECRTGSTLDFGVMAAKEEEYGVECVSSDGTDFLLCNLGKGKGSATLKVDVV